MFNNDAEIKIVFWERLSENTTSNSSIIPHISNITVNDAIVDRSGLTVSWSLNEAEQDVLTLSGLQSGLLNTGAIVSVTFETITNVSRQIILDTNSTIHTVVQAPN